MIGEISQPLSVEATMPDSSRDTRQTKPDSDKKQPETVQLTAEELKSIAGGMQQPQPNPTQGNANDVLKSPGVKGSRP
jgi:hypothetical protein